MVKGNILQKKKRVVHVLLFLFFIFSVLSPLYFLPSHAYASAEWEVTLRVEAGTGHNELVLGADDTATDGYDPVWEVYAMLGGDIKAYFPHPEWGMVHQLFWRDIKGKTSGTTEWLFEINSSLSNTNFTITWDLSRVPDSYTIILTDETTLEAIDMHATDFYSFNYSTGVMTFRVAVTVLPEVAPPDPPQRLRGRSVGTAVILLWTRNRERDIAGYNIYRSSTSGSGYQKINSSLNKWSLYVDRNVKPGETYYYVITAVNTEGGESGYSNEFGVTVFNRWRNYPW